jgi:hypothetical protein
MLGSRHFVVSATRATLDKSFGGVSQPMRHIIKSSYLLRAFLLVVFLGVPFLCARTQTAALPARITQTVDESSLTVLKGNRHPLTIPANDRGETAPDLPMERMLLVLKRDPSLESDLQRLLVEQQDRSSPRFHSWLTPEQFGERFGVSASDLATISGWLKSHGFRVNRIARSGMAIEFSGTAAQVKEAFHTPIDRYAINGETRYANASDPEIPSSLAPAVTGVSTLHNFQKPPTIHVLGSAGRVGNTSTWQPNFTFNGFFGAAHYLAPGDFAKIYNTASLYSGGIDGTGQSIAIVGRSNINLSDLQIFRIAFGLPTNEPQVILDGADPGNLFGGDEAEADLDVEWSGAVAPKATIKFVVSGSTNSTDGADLSAQYIVDNNLAPILSSSFGQCEQMLGQAENAFYNNLWEQAAAQGITVIVSSGDSGAAGCDSPFEAQAASHGTAVNGLASTPFNVALGGTQFNENGADNTYWSPTNGANQASVLGYIPENVWNESCSDISQCQFISLFASGGGPSGLYAKPSWQAGPGVPNDGKRDLPDVSLAAAAFHDGYLLCQDGICLTDSTGQLINAEVVGGTSAAAPTFAAIMALVDQKTNSRQGQANFVLYPLAASQSTANCNASAGPPQSPCIFNDVTQGNNNVPGQAGASAGTGYDLATGLGSVNATNLVNSWSNLTFRPTSTSLQVTPTTLTHGQSVTATVTVAPTSGTGTPTGDVALLPGNPSALNLGVLGGTGSVSALVSALPGGSYSLAASYGGDLTFGASTSPGVAVTVSPEASSTSFSTLAFGPNGNLAPASSIGYSDFLFFETATTGASNQGSATGTITFTDTFNGNTTALMTVPVDVRGNVFAQETSLAVGTHTLNANYSGDPSFTAGSASPATLTVTKGTTQAFLLIPNGALPNSSVFLEAAVFPNGLAAPTGTVQFTSNGQALGNPVPLLNLFATLTTTQLANGADTIAAVYSGDANFNGSSSPPSVLYVGNPDFQLAANPGNVTVSSGSPGQTKLLLAPGPGLGYVGTVLFNCAGLPTGVTCSFQPPQLNLDGFTSTSDTVTISKSATQAATKIALRQPAVLNRFLGTLAAACVGLLMWPGKRRRWHVFVLLSCFLAVAAGCRGGSNSTPPSSGSSPTGNYVVTVTATAGSGAQAVAHSVTLSLTIQ